MGDGYYVLGVGSRVGGIAVNAEGCCSRWDFYLLAVGAGFDENALSGGGSGAQGINGFLDLKLLEQTHYLEVCNVLSSRFRSIQQ